jgi:hypothetical protein
VRKAEVTAVEVEILVDGQGAVQRVELRHNADEPPRVGRMQNDVDLRDANPAAGGQRAGGGDGDGGRFAGAVGAQQAEDLALLQLQVDAIESHHAELGIVDLGQVFNFNNQEVHRRREGQ